MSAIPIVRALACVAPNHEKFCITGHVCENRGQGGFEPKQYHIDRRRQFRRLLCTDFKDFKWCLIAASAGDDDLFITASVLQLCIHVQKAWRAARDWDEDSVLSQSYVREGAEEDNWDSKAPPSSPFFLSSPFFAKHRYCHSPTPAFRRETFLPRESQRGECII